MFVCDRLSIFVLFGVSERSTGNLCCSFAAAEGTFEDEQCYLVLLRKSHRGRSPGLSKPRSTQRVTAPKNPTGRDISTPVIEEVCMKRIRFIKIVRVHTLLGLFSRISCRTWLLWSGLTRTLAKPESCIIQIMLSDLFSSHD